MITRTRILHRWALGLIMLVLVGLVGYMDTQDIELDHELYCDMVKLNRENPANGWPDYRDIYDKECPR